MSEPFLAEVRIFGFNFPPRGWATCDGQLLPINQNQSLFSLLGTTYGGDGRTSFALPDLRGRTPIHFDSPHPLGDRDGEEGHILTTGEIPSHTHAPRGSTSDVDSPDPDGRMLGNNVGLPYRGFGSAADMTPDTITNAGGGQPHNNMQPFLTLNFCVALQGLFPARN